MPAWDLTLWKRMSDDDWWIALAMYWRTSPWMWWRWRFGCEQIGGEQIGGDVKMKR